MIGCLNHVAIVVPDLREAALKYQQTLGAEVSEQQELVDHGVILVFVQLANTKIELLHPLGANSPISLFLERNPAGGIHHVCYEVDNIYEAANVLQEMGAKILGDGEPKIGAHGKPVLFLHPKEFFGTLIELEQK
ncbi:MAG: methylmalonyl-CoA epimerase [Rhodospirillaceae bacterium]|nr:methylmalonyl-CoA epimerase [Rhodospirillaceae bacterium]|tara:strand:- start:7947 stop:8351 length:405 start_codon:yes stop_codon:yes gene_type:complete